MRAGVAQGVLRKIAMKGGGGSEGTGKKRWATLTTASLTYYHNLRVCVLCC